MKLIKLCLVRCYFEILYYLAYSYYWLINSEETFPTKKISWQVVKKDFNMLPGETRPNCDVCGKHLEFKVLCSNAGYYIGTECCMGPNSRESHYYPTYPSAKIALDNNTVNWR